MKVTRESAVLESHVFHGLEVVREAELEMEKIDKLWKILCTRASNQSSVKRCKSGGNSLAIIAKDRSSCELEITPTTEEEITGDEFFHRV